VGGLVVILVIIVVIVLCVTKKSDTSVQPSPNHTARVPVCPSRCPNCGSAVRQRGNQWECGWCGDFGNCGYLELPNCDSDEDIDLENAKKDWEQIMDAVKVLCPERGTQKTWEERFAAYAISDALLQFGNYEEKKSLLLRFLKDTQSTVPPSAFEHLSAPLFQDECQLSEEKVGGYWKEIFSALSPESTKDDPGELTRLSTGMDSLFDRFGDGLNDRDYSGIAADYRWTTVEKNAGKTYLYCTVKFPEYRRAYSYLMDEPDIGVDDFVSVPFGAENQEKIGQVVSVQHCSAENAPFPPSRTKHIIGKAEKQEMQI